MNVCFSGTLAVFHDRLRVCQWMGSTITPGRKGCMKHAECGDTLILVFEFLIVAVLFRRVKMLASGRGNLAWICCHQLPGARI